MTLYEIIYSFIVYGGSFVFFSLATLYMFSKVANRKVPESFQYNEYLVSAQPDSIIEQIRNNSYELEVKRREQKQFEENVQKITLYKEKDIKIRSTQRYTILNETSSRYYKHVSNY